MSAVIDWALYTEPAVGRGSPDEADVINRPLRQVLELSGLDPDVPFAGFSVVGHTHTAGDVVAGTLSPSRGGTGRSDPTPGSLLVAAGAAAMLLLAPGASGQVVRSNGAAWTADVMVASDISDLPTAATGITRVGTITVGTWQGSPIADTYIATLSVAGKVANSATTATAANTANAIVARDASGNFVAGTITANVIGAVTGSVTGNAGTATKLSSLRTFGVSGDAAGSVGSDLTSGVTISLSLAAGVISDANIASTAAIAYSKLSLTGAILNTDISAGAGIVDTKFATISTPGKVANSATTATAVDAVGTIVARDGSGNFAAGTITASFAGDGSMLTSLNAAALSSGVIASARLAGAYNGITQVGTLLAGIWNATVISPVFGGTGLNAAAVGDLMYGSGANTWARLAGNPLPTRKFLVQAGDSVNPAAPSWGNPTPDDIVAGTFNGLFTFRAGLTSGIVPVPSAAASLLPNRTTIFVTPDTNDGTARAGSVMVTGYGAPPAFTGVTAGGSPQAPLAVSPGTNLVEMIGVGFDGVTWSAGGRMRVNAAEVWTSTAHGSQLVFSTTPNGSTALTDVLTIGDSGAVAVLGDVTVNTNKLTITASTGALTAAGQITTTAGFLSGVAGSGTGGRYVARDDGGNDRWQWGLLSTVGARNWSLYDFGNNREAISVHATTGVVTLPTGLVVGTSLTAASLSVAGAASAASLTAGTATLTERLTIDDATGIRFTTTDAGVYVSASKLFIGRYSSAGSFGLSVDPASGTLSGMAAAFAAAMTITTTPATALILQLTGNATTGGYVSFLDATASNAVRGFIGFGTTLGGAASTEMVLRSESSTALTFSGGNVGLRIAATTGAVTVPQALVVSGLASFNSVVSIDGLPTAATFGNTGLPNKRVMIGYDAVSDYGFVSAIHTGTANKTLFLNPIGGGVRVGVGGFFVDGAFGCNGNTPQTKAVSGGTVGGVIAALVANGILSS